MIQPLRARFGNQDNRHALLEWNGAPAVLPFSLTNLTDAPPNSGDPGLRWWPSVGCGPFEEWWALWWTVPDEHSRRGGMVRSNVALWRRADIGQVDDLLPVMESLAGQSISMPPSEILAGVADALLSGAAGTPVIFDIGSWSGIISALWRRLWPEVRQSFSARVAITPPQGGESVAPPWLFCAPIQRKLQWDRYREIVAVSEASNIGRAAKWLIGAEDRTFSEVLDALSTRPSDIRPLRMIGVASDQLDLLRLEHTPDHGLDFVRTLIALAPTSDGASALKVEGLTALERGILTAPTKLISQLANLDISKAPNSKSLISAVSSWTTQNGSSLSNNDIRSFFLALRPKKATEWWQQSIRAGFSIGLESLSPVWAKALLGWFELADFADIVDSLLPTSENAERRLLDVISIIELSPAAWKQLRERAVQRRWSRLHAWAVMKTLSPADAFRAQRDFPGNAIAGLAVIVERLPGAVIVDESITSPETAIIELVAKRTAREPGLLTPLDPSSAGWRRLWAAHVKSNGPVWPPLADRAVVGRGLLDAVLQGDEPEGLITAAAEGLAATMLEHPRRSELWNALRSKGREALLARVSEMVFRRLNAGETIATIESTLRDAVLERARKERPLPNAIVTLFQWGAPVTENDLLGWLVSPVRNEWASNNADELGHHVLTRGWKRVAETLYDRSSYIVELWSAAKACESC